MIFPRSTTIEEPPISSPMIDLSTMLPPVGRCSAKHKAGRTEGTKVAIEIVKEDGLHVITINRPERRNALDLEHFGALADAWIDFRDDAGARIAIITGVGNDFCVGADLKSFVPMVTENIESLAS